MSIQLEKIRSPKDTKCLSDNELTQLCEEIRAEIIETVSHNGGHLASNLGVVELTVALHKVFNLPDDSIVWDVGHQSYTHKLLTGRYNEFSTIRTENGLSGFPSREESVYDIMTCGHSSTSVSSALGIAEANFMQGNNNYSIAVIGDGALTGGLAYEGMNNAGRSRRNMIVILNDNTMSISKNVGSIARHLTYIRTKPGYLKVKKDVENFASKIPLIGKPVVSFLKSVKRRIKKLFYNSTLFEDLGFTYYGPFNGHSIKDLTKILETAKVAKKPVLVHIVTNKGKGYKYAEESPSEFHGISAFDVETGEKGSSSKNFSEVFGDSLCRLADENKNICAITAAMRDGTGLTKFRDRFRNRFFDVGIAEGHGVTFAGGIAAKGGLPVFAVYSTFLQRSYDQLIHDVALQNTKVILAIDRAGVVGEDGKTHQGLFDTAYLQNIPNTTVYSPSFFDELDCQLEFLVKKENGLCAIRYPRGGELWKPEYFEASSEPFQIYGDIDAQIAIVTYGRVFSFAAQAHAILKKKGIKVKLIKLNRIIPVDKNVVEAASNSKAVFFYEEAVKNGGIGEHFAYMLTKLNFSGKYHLQAVENPFVEHASMFNTIKKLELDAVSMSNKIIEIYSTEKAGEGIEKKA